MSNINLNLLNNIKSLGYLVVLVATFLILSFNNLFLTSPSAQINNSTDKERIVVRFRSIVPKGFQNRVLKGQGAQNINALGLDDSFVIEVSGTAKDIVIQNLSRNFLVEYAEEDFLAEKFEEPNDTYYKNQWGLSKINVPGAWDVVRGSTSVNIAIVDTGINYIHPDLASKLAKSVNCTFSNCPNYLSTDPDGHGTHVAGIAAAVTDNTLGVAGTLWEGNLFSVKALDDSGSGYYSWIANAIVWAVENEADVINLSLGGRFSSFILRDAVEYAWENGAIIIASAGNNGSTIRNYPAYYDEAIAVSATDSNDNIAFFSNYGDWVDVAAPGVSILSTYTSGYAYSSGTSMAAPFVSGIAGLIKADNPSWTNQQVREKLELSADKISGTGSLWVHGRVNACNSVDCDNLSDPEATPTETPDVTSTPTVTLAPTLTPTPTLTPSPTPLPTLTPTALPTATPTLTQPTPTPAPSTNLPWWCSYIPWHSTCQ